MAALAAMLWMASGARAGELVYWDNYRSEPGTVSVANIDIFVNLDSSGAGVLGTPGAEVNEPYGVAIDPKTRIVYWTNGKGGPEGKAPSPTPSSTAAVGGFSTRQEPPSPSPIGWP